MKQPKQHARKPHATNPLSNLLLVTDKLGVPRNVDVVSLGFALANVVRASGGAVGVEVAVVVSIARKEKDEAERKRTAQLVFWVSPLNAHL